MWPTGRAPHWVGRARELAVLHDSIEALRQGRGSVAWIEGEPGIGKSSLVAEAVAAGDPGWDVGWGMADQLSKALCEGMPLAVRNALHAEAARQLAAADADPLSVARQLSLSGLPGKGWAAGRLTQAAPC